MCCTGQFFVGFVTRDRSCEAIFAGSSFQAHNELLQMDKDNKQGGPCHHTVKPSSLVVVFNQMSWYDRTIF